MLFVRKWKHNFSLFTFINLLQGACIKFYRRTAKQIWNVPKSCFPKGSHQKGKLLNQRKMRKILVICIYCNSFFKKLWLLLYLLHPCHIAIYWPLCFKMIIPLCSLINNMQKIIFFVETSYLYNEFERFFNLLLLTLQCLKLTGIFKKNTKPLFGSCDLIS